MALNVNCLSESLNPREEDEVVDVPPVGPGDVVRVPDALIQPIPADQVAAALAAAALAEPRNGIANVAGPKKITFEQLARDSLARKGDETKTVIVDSAAHYFGAALSTNSLVTPD